MAWHWGGMALEVCVCVSTSSQGTSANSTGGGKGMSMSWFVGVFVLWGSFGVRGGFGATSAVVGAAGVARVVSCLMLSGVSGVVWIGMSGQVSAKHLGCHDSPQLWVLRTRHSLPTRSLLQMLQVALVWGARCGCMVV